MLTDKMKKILLDNGFKYHPEQHVDFECDPMLTEPRFDKPFPRYDNRYEEVMPYHLNIYDCGYFQVTSPYGSAETDLSFDRIEDMNDLGIVLKHILNIGI